MIYPFINREKEMRMLERLTDATPDILYVVYGPVNSGKSELLRRFLKKKIIEGRKTYYVNFRLKSVISYEDVVEALMEEIKSEELMELAKTSVGVQGDYEYSKWSRMVGMSTAFNYWIRDLKKHEGERAPIVVLDGIEKLKNINGRNGLMMYEIMNFGIGISKEEHLAHVFVVSNNSVMVDKIHTNAELNTYVEYIKVEDLEEETARKFLSSQGLEKEQIDKVIDRLGTKPLHIIRAAMHKDNLDEYIESIVNVRSDQIFQMLNALRLENPELHRAVVEILHEVDERKEMRYLELNRALKWLIDTNILFLDPLNRKVKYQGRLEEIGVREYLHLRKENGCESSTT